MRFDDKLATVLAQPRTDAAARAAAWRQIVDILAQRSAAEADVPLADDALALLRALRDEVPQAVRAEAVAAIAGRRVHPAIVGLIAEERPAIAAALIGRVVLDDAAWLALLPRLSPVARSLLRHRRDLSPAVTAGLASFGTSDFALPPADPAPVAAALLIPLETPQPPAEGPSGETQIRDLLDRIAAYRRDEPPVAAATPVLSPAETFRFETGADGVILWVEGAPRGPLIGATIARAAASLGHGVDGQAAGAFRHRAAFREARLSVAGESAASGEWRIAGVPVFDPRDGRFTGYRGTARRPRSDERAAVDGGLYGSGLPADSLRQLVHELRTPLNAIVGFGEMIERQVLGPAAFPYRARAAEIVDHGRRLLGAVDDLDMAARIDTRRLEATPDRIDATALLHRLREDFRGVADARGVVLTVAVAGGIGPVAADPLAIERMFARLLAATIGLGQPGETIAIDLASAGDDVLLRLSRPAIVGGCDERGLLDPGYTPEGDWPDAPVLGLGFALRLIRNLAAGAGGELTIEPGSFLLRLPAAGQAGVRTGAAPL
ncbi:sensor histidine kinase [Sphingomonas profundi]|uniref:sensor histidine kinase n=1 Tax=Alterirhizorhabdus profundi TaxID=2681549 RepID=UPI0012E85165|nr:histidine kinase dimerization/phospho-acceptor domain-containing protein [Sphingomonas profundi]